MKIAWVINRWLDEYGGRKIASKKILKLLSDLGHDVSLVDFEKRIKKGDHYTRLIELDKKIKYIPIFLKKNKEIPFKIIAFFKKNDFDLVVCSSFSYIDLLMVVIMKLFFRNKRPKIILFEHTSPRESILNQPFKSKYIFLFLSKIFYKQFDHIVVTGDRIKNVFFRDYAVEKNKITVIHYPIIPMNIKVLKRQKIHNPLFNKDGVKLILTAARLETNQKDFLTLFHAFKLVIKKLSNAYLIVLGTGWDKRKVKNMARKINILNRVKFLGYQINPFKYMAQSHVFVLSSLFEGTGMVLVESMACGTPVISSDCPVGPRETLENGRAGILIPIKDSKRMSDAIFHVLTDINLRNKLVLNGLRRARDFKEDASMVGWKNFIEKIL